MTVDTDALAAEFKSLRRGRAMRHPGALRRLGPHIRELCDIADSDGLVTARTKLTAIVDELLKDQQVPKLAVLTALALHPQADHRQLSARERYLAEQLNCHDRTARRRVDEGFELLVLAAVDRTTTSVVSTPDGWQVQSFRAVLRLDGASPELTEERTILVTRDGLDQIVCLLSVPKPRHGAAPAHDLIAEILFGGHIGATERPSDEHFRYHVDLPRTYRKGQLHEYGIRFRLPPGQPMVPHYVFLPLVACKSFDMTVKFDLAALPDRVWRLNELAPRVVDVACPKAEVCELDRFGELRLVFRNLRQGFAYGIKWAYASGESDGPPQPAVSSS